MENCTIYEIAAKLATELNSQPDKDTVYEQLVLKRLVEIADDHYRSYEFKLNEIERKINIGDLTATSKLLVSLSKTSSAIASALTSRLKLLDCFIK